MCITKLFALSSPLTDFLGGPKNFMATGDYATHADNRWWISLSLTKALLGPRKNRISWTIKPTDLDFSEVKYAEKKYIDLQFLKIFKRIRGESQKKS